MALQSGASIIGAASLDCGIDIVIPQMIDVGSESSILYAVQLPF